MAHRIKRLHGTPYSIAAGFACGAAISFTPFIGFHFLLSALLAWLIRANIISSAIGTVVGNPWTFPFIWIATYKIGNWTLGRGGQLAMCPDFAAGCIFDNLGAVLLPMLIGSIPLGTLVWLIFYFPLRRIVQTYQIHRARRRRAPEFGHPDDPTPAAAQPTRESNI